MDLLREKLKARSAAKLQGGGGGGGGGGDIGDGVSPSAGPGAGPGAPGTGPSTNSDVGIGNNSPGASGGMPGIGLGQTNMSTMGLQGLGLAMGLPTVGLSGMATIGNAINGVTGFGGGTPSSSVGNGGDGVNGFNPIYGTGSEYTGVFPFGVDGRGGPAGNPASLYGPGFAGMSPGVFPGMGANQNIPGAPGYTLGGAATNSSSSTSASGSAEEQALRAAQLDLVNRQRDIAAEMLRRQNLMEGELMRAQGYEQVLGPDGQVSGYRPTADLTARQNSENEINDLMRTRTLAALKGELPVDPALERSIGENRATLEAQLRGNLGSGYATSTPGQTALADYDKRAEELRMAQRKDQLSTGEGIRLAGEDLSNRISSSRFGNIMGLGNVPSGAAGLYSQAGAGLTPSLANILGNTNAGVQRYLGELGSAGNMFGQVSANNRTSQQLAAADNAGFGQLVGSLGSAFISNPGSFGNLFSNIGSGLGSLGSGIGDFVGGLFG